VGIAITGPYVADTTCHFSGDTATFVMTVTNNTSVPDQYHALGADARRLQHDIGTSPGRRRPAPAGSRCRGRQLQIHLDRARDYRRQLSCSPTAKPTFFVTGSATANPGSITSPVVTAPAQDVDGFVVTVSPIATPMSSQARSVTELDNSSGARACRRNGDDEAVDVLRGRRDHGRGDRARIGGR